MSFYAINRLHRLGALNEAIESEFNHNKGFSTAVNFLIKTNLEYTNLCLEFSKLLKEIDMPGHSKKEDLELQNKKKEFLERFKNL